MRRELWVQAAIDLIERDDTAVLVTQCTVEGSAPREVGARMVVGADGIVGSIGGGNLEFLAIEQAKALFVRTDMRSLLQDYPLGPLLAQCCGGHVRLLLERLTAEDLEWLKALLNGTDNSAPTLLETRLVPHGARKRIIEMSDGVPLLESGGDTVFLDKDRQVLDRKRPPTEQCAFVLEVLAAPGPPVFIYGAGHVGQAIAHVLRISDFRLWCYDSREDYWRQTVEPPIGRLDDVETVVRAAPTDTIHLIMTHSHALDYRLTRAILLRGRFSYCGLIGSETKRARFLRRLQDDGVCKEQIARLTCPIGIPDVPGKTPAEIAVSVASQLFGLRSGHAHSAALKPLQP